MIGAETHEIQTAVPNGALPSQLLCATENDHMSLMLGSFPDAQAKAFHLDGALCSDLADVDDVTARQDLLLRST